MPLGETCRARILGDAAAKQSFNFDPNQTSVLPRNMVQETTSGSERQVSCDYQLGLTNKGNVELKSEQKSTMSVLAIHHEASGHYINTQNRTITEEDYRQKKIFAKAQSVLQQQYKQARDERHRKFQMTNTYGIKAFGREVRLSEDTQDELWFFPFW